MQQDRPDKSRRDAAILNQWLGEQRARPQYRAAPKANRAIAKIMKPLSAKFGAGRSGLVDHWEEIIGPRFSRISRPERFLGGRDGRTLLISAPGPAAALISAAGQTIIDRVNSYLGPNYIRHIKVTQSRIKDSQLAGGSQKRTKDLTHGQKEKLKSSLENIKDPDLRQALEKLGRQAITRNDT